MTNEDDTSPGEYSFHAPRERPGKECLRAFDYAVEQVLAADFEAAIVRPMRDGIGEVRRLFVRELYLDR